MACSRASAVMGFPVGMIPRPFPHDCTDFLLALRILRCRRRSARPPATMVGESLSWRLADGHESHPGSRSRLLIGHAALDGEKTYCLLSVWSQSRCWFLRPMIAEGGHGYQFMPKLDMVVIIISMVLPGKHPGKAAISSIYCFVTGVGKSAGKTKRVHFGHAG